jgi:hypothetical protein
LIIAADTQIILAVDHAKGAVHDFSLFKWTLKAQSILATHQVLADSGYQGLAHHHKSSMTPKKKPRKKVRS